MTLIDLFTYYRLPTVLNWLEVCNNDQNVGRNAEFWSEVSKRNIIYAYPNIKNFPLCNILVSIIWKKKHLHKFLSK